MTERDSQLAPLPAELVDELLAAVMGDSRQKGARIEALAGKHPQHAVAIRAHAARHEVLVAAGTVAEKRSEAAADERTEIGPYRILERLGEGGMGTVYLAERRNPTRRVALKVIKLGMDTKAVLARFEAEREALARMEHSHIAKVFDAGATDRGQPYFAMEYVKGDPITRYCDRARLSIEERLALFRQVCSGVQHAHTKGVVHRDLTPNNILVTLQDGKPAAKIIDFGLAKATDHRLTERTLFTEHGKVLGTPEYMAPEQAGVSNLDIDTRADVYTLGVLLYELLVGTLPFESQDLRKAGYEAMCRTIQEKDPPRPSTRVTRVGESSTSIALMRRIDVADLHRRLAGDLDWIVMKCLEKDRTRRYETVSALSDDIERHLQDRPIEARPPSAAYAVRKFARRFRGQLIAAGAVVFALVGGIIGMAYFWQEAANRAREAEAATRREAKQTEEVQRLSGQFAQLAMIAAFDQATQSRETLYPVPENVGRMRQWLQDARGLVAKKGEVEAALQGLQARLQAVTKKAAGTAESAAGNHFDDQRVLTFFHAQLTGLLGGLVKLQTHTLGAVEADLRFAERLGDLMRGHMNAAKTWEEARRAILKADGIEASELYRNPRIDLQRQTGLVPIGANPATKLWEFYELRSALADPAQDPAQLPIPRHEADGTVRVEGQTGIVFVLIPGGVATMGAQGEDSNQPNYDERAQTRDGPVHSVTLAPFFLAKHELTRGQWRRLTGDVAKPSATQMKDITDAHPMESVDWITAHRWLEWHGLSLPTEAQWEYACRAGTSGVWWSGSEANDLKGCANVLDLHVNPSRGWGQPDVDFDDGYELFAPVGSFRANPFGLHDMHGNVTEWCADWYLEYDKPARVGDGLREASQESGLRVHRGGSFWAPAGVARCAHRVPTPAESRGPMNGVRAARAVRP